MKERGFAVEISRLADAETRTNYEQLQGVRHEQLVLRRRPRRPEAVQILDEDPRD